MKLKPGCEQIYRDKHDAIWPGLVEQMRARGTRNYSIYRHGELLFAYAETAAGMPGPPPEPTEITRRWWHEMAPLMECNPDGSPWREPLQEVFHLD